MKYNAISVVNTIDKYKEDLKKSIMRRYYSKTIDELLEVGFIYLDKVIDDNTEYDLSNSKDKNIIEHTGNILVYDNIILAVTDNGVYINKPVDVKSGNIVLDFEHHVEFGKDMYENICKTINNFSFI